MIKVTNLLKQNVQAGIQTREGTVWVPSRPIQYQTIQSRFKDAFLVFIGRYDALDWNL